jgi:hypothetical protein
VSRRPRMTETPTSWLVKVAKGYGYVVEDLRRVSPSPPAYGLLAGLEEDE